MPTCLRARRALSMLLVGLLAACVAPSSRHPAAAAPKTSPATAMPNTDGPWLVVTAPVSQKIVVATDAVVVVSGEPATRTDTLRTLLGASYVQTANHRRVDGLLTDFRISVGGAALAVPAGLQLGRPFSAESPIPGGQYAFRLPAESSACTDPTLSSLQGIYEAWVPMPDTLKIGREWSDTLRTVTCRDRIMLHVTSVRRFRARRADVDSLGRVIVAIERTIKGQVVGSGDQFGEAVSIAGESSGVLRYLFDPAAGHFVRADGKAALSFTLSSRRRTQRAQQESQVTITWLP